MSQTVANSPLPRLDRADPATRARLLAECRLKPGDIWTDTPSGHRVGCLDAADAPQIARLMDGEQAHLAIHDPPYNLVAFERRTLEDYIAWCERWVAVTRGVLADDSSLYVWLGADQDNGFQPLPDFMIMMRKTDFRARSFITLRNQRGRGTPKNWMALRQELLYYTRGTPPFTPQYTDITKAVAGYIKAIGDVLTDNLARGKSPTIRAGNVWFDIQQVFYRREENVNGCYAQKPLRAIERIIQASSVSGATVIDFFAHSGTTLLAAERLGRRCMTADTDPIFCELTIRRLEHYRATGRTGWQNGNPFATDPITQD